MNSLFGMICEIKQFFNPTVTYTQLLRGSRKITAPVEMPKEPAKPPKDIVKKYEYLIKRDGSDPNELADVFIEVVKRVLVTMGEDPKKAGDMLHVLTGTSGDLYHYFGSSKANMKILKEKARNIKSSEFS